MEAHLIVLCATFKPGNFLVLDQSNKIINHGWNTITTQTMVFTKSTTINYPLKQCLRHAKVDNTIQRISINKPNRTINWIVIYLLNRVVHLFKHPGKVLTHWLLSFSPKMHSWDIFKWQFSAWKWAKLALMYSATWRHAFFWLLLDFCSGSHKIKLWSFFGWKSDLRL